MIKFFDTFEKKIVEFSPERNKDITIYNCWPTTHGNHTSIGNLRSYLFSDLLKRFFQYLWLSTKHVIKLTDVDDHIIQEIDWKKERLISYNEKHIEEFKKMLMDLNTLPIDYLPRVTENIDDIIRDIGILEEKWYTYILWWSLYFDTTKSEWYWSLLWELNKNSLINAQKRLEDIQNDNKKNPNDFCLWKAYVKEEWTIYRESPRWIWRPWRHSQCSTIARKYLWETIDIHWWWMSHIFPHHENERIQSEIITWKKFVKYRLHHEYIIFDDHCILLDEVKKRWYDPLVVRLFLIKKYYRSKLNFTYDSLDTTKQDIKKIIKFLLVLDSIQKTKISDEIHDHMRMCEEEIIKNLSDDMNVSSAITVLFEFINKINSLMMDLSKSDANLIKNFIFKLDNIFGFIKISYQKYINTLEEKIKNNSFDEKIKKWLELKESGNFEWADIIKKNLQQEWIEIEYRKGFNILIFMNEVIT